MNMDHGQGVGQANGASLETLRHFAVAADVRVPAADAEHAYRVAHLRRIAEEITKNVCDDMLPEDTCAELGITPEAATYIGRIIFVTTRHLLEDMQDGEISLGQEK